jgi:hypothetical protein
MRHLRSASLRAFLFGVLCAVAVGIAFAGCAQAREGVVCFVGAPLTGPHEQIKAIFQSETVRVYTENTTAACEALTK